MTDEELLTLAAKAADIEHGADRLYCGLSLTERDGRHRSLPQWNPLTDDGDALRLAVALGLMIAPSLGMTSVGPESGSGEVTEPHSGDPLAATRRAIVRAAAQIGQSQ